MLQITKCKLCNHAVKKGEPCRRCFKSNKFNGKRVLKKFTWWAIKCKNYKTCGGKVKKERVMNTSRCTECIKNKVK